MTVAPLVQADVPLVLYCTAYDDALPPLVGACHDSVTVVDVVDKSDKLLTWPGATAVAVPASEAKAIVPPE
jgi:hypothetical protein